MLQDFGRFVLNDLLNFKLLFQDIKVKSASEKLKDQMATLKKR